MMMGAYGEYKEITDEVRSLCNDVKTNIESNLNKTFTTFEPVSYKSQVVAGTNYLVKIKVDDGDYLHVKIFKALPCYGGNTELKEATAGHGETDTL
jgi:cystatin-A/B